MTQTKRKTVTKEMEFLNLILSERDVFAGKYLGTLPFNKSETCQIRNIASQFGLHQIINKPTQL